MPAGAGESDASRISQTARMEVRHSPLHEAISSQAWEGADKRKVGVVSARWSGAA
jgi:hypothetical protein